MTDIPWLVAVPFAINLVANLVFTPIQFGLRNLPLASLDIAVNRTKPTERAGSTASIRSQTASRSIWCSPSRSASS
jgi:hypothetical protein